MKRKVINALIVMIMLIVLIGVSGNSVNDIMNDAETISENESESIVQEQEEAIFIIEEENADYSVPQLDYVLGEAEFVACIEANPIDKAMKWEDISSEQRIMFAADYRDAWLAEIEHAFKILQEYLSESDYDTLYASYESWMEYTEGELEVEKKIYYPASEYMEEGKYAGFGMYYPIVMERAANRTKEYAVELLSLEFAMTGDVQFIYGRERMVGNDFFYTEGTSTIEYNGYIYPLSCVEKKQKVYLDVTEIETFENGTLYTLELQQIEANEEWGDISMGRRYLGYFYVTEDMIYRRAVETYDGFTEAQTKKWIALIESDEQSFIEQCYVVCSEEAVPDMEHENDYHTYIEAVGDLRIFQLYNDYVGGTDDYETIVWQKGKGIVYYEHGAGGMLMHVAFCDDSYYMDAVETYFVANVPELKKYREYIERESEGEASLTYHVCAVEGGIPGAEDNYGYLVYVGEQWEDHRANWDWFLVKVDLSKIYYYDIVAGDYWTLEGWRASERYRDLE